MSEIKEGLSIVIPVYNEEKSIHETIEFFKTLIEKTQNLEVIFVDDGSTDKTSDILKSFAADRISLLIHERNKGYGAAIKSGVAIATYDYIAITDADGSYPHEKVLELFKMLMERNVDMVVGARIGKAVKMGFFRKLAKYFLKRLAEFLTDCSIPDLNSGLRIVRKELIQKFMKFLPDRFSFTSTLTLLLLTNNYKIFYYPINYYRRTGQSKIRPLKDTLNFIQLIVRTVMFFNPLKVFLPVSLFFMFLSLVVLVVSYLRGKIMDITTILLFVTGLHLLALGLLADLIDKRLNR
ncbi:MAG: glycosyltransferase family 2 protein [Candidatus Aminicenantes bacterium]|nr:glycosyltransferase family 2 protein [Candidatus Aminicenantes bacterium]